MFSVPVPVLVNVTVCPALVVLSVWFPNARLVGDRLTAGGEPVVVNDQTGLVVSPLAPSIVAYQSYEVSGERLLQTTLAEEPEGTDALPSSKKPLPGPCIG
jgi:hypothetical protein